MDDEGTFAHGVLFHGNSNLVYTSQVRIIMNFKDVG